MKREMFFAVAWLVAVLMVPAQEWKLVWADEFDVDGRPAAHWSYEHGFVRNYELQWYQEANATVRDGCLCITGRHEAVDNPQYDPDSRDWRRNRRQAEFTSACLTTRESFTFKYGRLEVRARIPVACGSWPAIWTLGNRGGWPRGGEIDVMEFYRVPSDPTQRNIDHRAMAERDLPIILANACWADSSGRDAWDTSRTPYAHFTERDPLWASRFHTWRMDWTADTVALYLDDELLNTIPTAKAAPTRSERPRRGGGAQGGRRESFRLNPFSNDSDDFGHYILLNLAIGACGGTPDLQAFPLTYEIDYVRVYQLR